MWTLNQLGAITLNTTDNDGDGNGTDAGEIVDARTFNKANELTARDADNSGGTTPNNYTPGYDATGNFIDDDTRTPTGTYTFGHVYKYNPWGQLTKIYQQDGTTLVASYRYNAYGFQIEEHADVTRSGGGAPDGVVDSNDPKYFYAYSEDWKKQATYRGTDSSPKARYVNDAAGFDGVGGSSPMNRVVLQDVDTSNGGWTGASTGTYSRREYLLQDYQESISVVITSTGRIREWVKYSANGTSMLIPFSDVNSDLVINSQDFYDFLNLNNGSYAYDVRGDANINGNATESQDYYDFLADYFNTYAAGRGKLSRPDVYNRKGYAGYESINAENRQLLARHRVLDTLTTTWLSRDPLGAVDGMNVYAYVDCRSLIRMDPTGLSPFILSCVLPLLAFRGCSAADIASIIACPGYIEFGTGANFRCDCNNRPGQAQGRCSCGCYDPTNDEVWVCGGASCAGGSLCQRVKEELIHRRQYKLWPIDTDTRPWVKWTLCENAMCREYTAKRLVFPGKSHEKICEEACESAWPNCYTSSGNNIRYQFAKADKEAAVTRCKNACKKAKTCCGEEGCTTGEGGDARAIHRSTEPQPFVCQNCGYLLAGIFRCPECAREVDSGVAHERPLFSLAAVLLCAGTNGYLVAMDVSVFVATGDVYYGPIFGIIPLYVMSGATLAACAAMFVVAISPWYDRECPKSRVRSWLISGLLLLISCVIVVSVIRRTLDILVG